jgi:hydrogenase maturation protein HypF
VAQFAVEMCVRIREKTGLRVVALSGGVFANAILSEKLNALLEPRGFEVLMNRSVPSGDGGISLGQAAVAAWRLSCA